MIQKFNSSELFWTYIQHTRSLVFIVRGADEPSALHDFPLHAKIILFQIKRDLLNVNRHNTSLSYDQLSLWFLLPNLIFLLLLLHTHLHMLLLKVEKIPLNLNFFILPAKDFSHLLVLLLFSLLWFLLQPLEDFNSRTRWWCLCEALWSTPLRTIPTLRPWCVYILISRFCVALSCRRWHYIRWCTYCSIWPLCEVFSSNAWW